jgi:hypothetical protein
LKSIEEVALLVKINVKSKSSPREIYVEPFTKEGVKAPPLVKGRQGGSKSSSLSKREAGRDFAFDFN